MTGPEYWAAKARRHARNAKIAFWVSVLAAIVAVLNAVLVVVGVYR